MSKLNTETQLPQAIVMPRFYCGKCDSIYPCSTQNFGI